MSYVERLVVDSAAKETILYDEHIVRYDLAKKFVHEKKVLDIACGSGYGAQTLIEAGARSVLAVDADAEAIMEAKREYTDTKIEFKVGNAERLDIADGSIDVITSFETIEHLNDYEAYLKELARIVTGEGVAFISTPNRDVFGQKNPFHIKEFARAEFETALQAYFPFVVILEQKNAISTCIVAEQSGDIIINDNASPALYFVAICSKRAITEAFPTVASLNVRALKRWENNPGWKLVNSVYALGQKLGIFKN